jgi:isocitrate dehydrogenase kinase/phosphatase
VAACWRGRAQARFGRAGKNGNPEPEGMPAMFPHRLTDSRAYRHRAGDARRLQPPLPAVPRDQPRGQARFEQADWHGQQRASASASSSTTCAWTRRPSGCSGVQGRASCRWTPGQQVKLHYIGLLVDHHQPELAETFFNSVTTKILHRSYFRNDFIFVRPGGQHRVHRERRARRAAHLPRLLPDARHAARHAAAHRRQLPAAAPIRGPGARHRRVLEAMHAPCGRQVRLRANFQIQVLSSLFFRNKGAYLVGKIINGFNETPFALPILHNDAGSW